MSNPFNQGVPSVPTLINSSSTNLYGNSATGNALSVQQLGSGNVVAFSNASGGSNVFVMNNLGYVGVGTTNPGAPLDVKSFYTLAARFKGVNDHQIQYYSGAAGATFTGQDGGSATYRYFQNDTQDKMRFYQGAGGAVVFQPTAGNVGIGTASPGGPLDVFTGTNEIFLANSDSTGVYPKVSLGTGGGFARNAVLNIYNTETGSTVSSNNSMMLTYYNGSAGWNPGDPGAMIAFQQRWWSGNNTMAGVGGIRGVKTQTNGTSGGGIQLLYCDGTTYSTGMTLDHNGRVGIGTASPSFKLSVDIVSSTAIVAAFIQASAMTAGQYMGFALGKNNTTNNAGTFIWNHVGDGLSTNYLGLGYWGGDNKLNITAGGNVGIGVTNPGSTLTVNGTFSATSTKSFDIPHPTFKNKRLVHACIEAPRVDLIYRNTKILVNGTATVNIDLECTKDSNCAMSEGTFEALCVNPQIFLQNTTGFDPVIGSITGNELTIRCQNPESTDTISWMVVAERHDAGMLSSNTSTTNSDGYLITEYDAPSAA